MTPEEMFLFDLHGYLLIKNVLSPEEVAALNTLADEKVSPIAGKKDRRLRVSNWGPASQALIDHPRILPYLLTRIDTKFRLDHDYCIFMEPGAAGGNLHGGEGYEGDHWYKYRDGQMKNGLCVVTMSARSVSGSSASTSGPNPCSQRRTSSRPDTRIVTIRLPSGCSSLCWLA